VNFTSTCPTVPVSPPQYCNCANQERPPAYLIRARRLSLNLSSAAYRWPVVTDFQHWRFGKPARHLDTMRRNPRYRIKYITSIPIKRGGPSTRYYISNSAFECGTAVAHLIPDHERQWFLSNSIDRWNTDLTPDPHNPPQGLSNAAPPRSDTHLAFDKSQIRVLSEDRCQICRAHA
jgi:hypothetical protein